MSPVVSSAGNLLGPWFPGWGGDRAGSFPGEPSSCTGPVVQRKPALKSAEDALPSASKVDSQPVDQGVRGQPALPLTLGVSRRVTVAYLHEQG